MSHELVKASPVIVPATVTSAALPTLVKRAGGAARFAWDLPRACSALPVGHDGRAPPNARLHPAGLRDE